MKLGMRMDRVVWADSQAGMKLYATEIAASANRAVTIEYKIGHH